MQTFNCQCGNTLFFDSNFCVNCKRDTVTCPHCANVTPVEETPSGALQCGNTACGALLRRCSNDLQYDACNRALDANDVNALCSYCRLNSVVPDLSRNENVTLWRKLEAAKHRVLWVVERLGFPVSGNNALQPNLTFEFKSDENGKVSTGHADGCITISLREADSVEREKTRVEFQEPKRTLVGHFRHELGHYYWDLLVRDFRVEESRRLFGDERNPTYADSQKRYYQQGPAKNWQQSYVSGYASMHPWEDFAETFQAYLDMATILSTTEHFGLVTTSYENFDSMLAAYSRVGIIANELNRDMGLLDLVPQIFNDFVVEKLRFIHQLPVKTEKVTPALTQN